MLIIFEPYKQNPLRKELNERKYIRNIEIMTKNIVFTTAYHVLLDGLYILQFYQDLSTTEVKMFQR